MLGLGTSLSSIYVPQASGYVNEYSAAFDGANDYFNTGDPFTTTIKGSFTISYWIKTTELNTGGDENHFGTFSVSGAMSYFELQTRPTGHLRLNFKGMSGPSGAWITDSAVLDTTNGTDGNWMHIGVVVNRPGSGNISAKIYINGSEVAVTNSTTMDIAAQASFDNSPVPLTFAALKVASGSTVLYHMSCSMDEIAIWNASLSDASMAVVGNGVFDLTSGSGDYAQQGDLVSYYKFTEGSGTSVEDATGNNDGTLVNGASFDASTP